MVSEPAGVAPIMLSSAAMVTINTSAPMARNTPLVVVRFNTWLCAPMAVTEYSPPTLSQPPLADIVNSAPLVMVRAAGVTPGTIGVVYGSKRKLKVKRAVDAKPLVMAIAP